MRYYDMTGGKPVLKASLWEALRLSPMERQVISLVGAGGKTSLMYGLAKEAAAMGKRVIVTTSTHIFYPEEYQVLLTEKAAEAGDIPWQENILVVGQRAGSEKLKGISESEIEKLADYADILLVEADGARRLPCKVPGEHEPVMIPCTDTVIACTGLDAIGMSLKDSCFRWERAEELFDIAAETVVTPEHVVRMLTSDMGGRKHVEDRQFRVVFNKLDMAGDGCLKQLNSLMADSSVVCAVTSFQGR